ncbi:MAG: flagellar basal body P-ring protein FlgI [Betaproteobacteria bacterium]|nr:flagellar basal body P-ring protein FlgI [Betaproteobacteria bacterium]
MPIMKKLNQHQALLQSGQPLRWSKIFFAIIFVAANAYAASGNAVRIKEIAAVHGVRTNQLTGYGLVVGLDGTGDQTTQMPYTTQSLSNYLNQMGVVLPPGTTSPQLKNVAAVLVTAQLPAFAQPGQQMDVNVSSIGNAKSLKGGTLITTPLKGVDGEIYALAQGNLVVSGAGASGGGSKVQINHLSAGRIPDGAQVERAIASPLQLGDSISLGLTTTDFQMAKRVAEAINRQLGEGRARAMDGRTVKVAAPMDANDRVSFLAEIEEVTLEASVPSAKVIINARTGSIVLNQAVTLGPCAVAHGNLSISISSTPNVSQPNALSGGQTVVTEKTNIQIRNEPGGLIQIPAAAQLQDVVRALNALGATPQDMLAILQAIKAAGALNAELEVI